MRCCPMMSVIIPTHNRAAILRLCLEALQRQVGVPEFEVIIVDDGSTDDTYHLVSNVQRNYGAPLHYLSQTPHGPAVARNLALAHAQGEILLIIGDDIIPARDDFLSQHSNWHLLKHPEENVAVLGKITWPPEYTVTPYMKWLEEGPQFSYHKLAHGVSTTFEHFYTSNVSLKKRFLGDTRFDESFRYAAYEDIELAYRLASRGLRVVHNSHAIAHHYHPVRLRGNLNRAFLVGKSRFVLDRLHPEQHLLRSLKPHKLRMYELIFNSLTRQFLERVGEYFETRRRASLLWHVLYRYHYLRGYAYEGGSQNLPGILRGGPIQSSSQLHMTGPNHQNVCSR